MMLIYTDTITPRIRYTFEYLFRGLYQVPVSFTTEEQIYFRHDEEKLIYSEKKFDKPHLYWPATTLLKDPDIREYRPLLRRNDQGNITFHINDNAEHDPFAGAFFLLSRYEEYLPFPKDQYDRFEAVNSFVYPDFLQFPLVNIWAEEIFTTIKTAYPLLHYSRNKFSTVITIDIDQAYAVQHKPWYRQGAIILRGMTSSSSIKSKSALAIISGKIEDPFDTFKFIEQEAFESNIPFLFFVNVGKRTDYDKNISTSSLPLKALLAGLSKWADVGVHPSYYVLEKPSILTNEIAVLGELIGKKIEKSRQHYIRLRLPDTYEHLIENGILHDYSMGYASYPGFRAGACTPFKWFNLNTNSETDLELFPFTFMEGTFAEDLNQRPADSWDPIASLIDTVKKHDGLFIPIWHNHSLSDTGTWQGWKEIFQRMIKYIQ